MKNLIKKFTGNKDDEKELSDSLRKTLESIKESDKKVNELHELDVKEMKLRISVQKVSIFLGIILIGVIIYKTIKG